MPTRTHHVGVLLVVLLMLVADVPFAVAASPGPGISPSPSPAASATPVAVFPSDEAFVTVLAGAGVAVVPDEVTPEPIVPVAPPEVTRLTAWQARTMAAELRAGGGMRGSDLDRAVRIGRTRLPFSYLLAAWISTGTDDGAAALRRSMGPQDWSRAPEVLFPSATLTLFAAATARAALGPDAAPPPSPSPSPSGSPEALALGRGSVAFALLGPLDAPACSSLTAFVDGAMDSLFAALRIDTAKLPADVGGRVLGFFAGIWNVALGIAKGVVKATLTELTRPVVTALRTAVATGALISQLTSYLKPWVIAIEAAPAAVTVPLGGSPAGGTFRARADVSPTAQQWPPLLLDCAAALGVTLPSLAVAGAPVRWTTSGSGSAYLKLDGGPEPVRLALAQDQTSTVAWQTTTDPIAWEEGDLVTDPVRGAASVQRRELTELIALARRMTLGQLPSGLEPTIKITVGPVVDGLLAKAAAVLAPLLDARDASPAVLVTHRAPPRADGLRVRTRLQSRYSPRVHIDWDLRSCDATGSRWTGTWRGRRPGYGRTAKVRLDFGTGDTATWSITTTEPLGNGGTITGTHDYVLTRTRDAAGVTSAIAIDGTASALGRTVPESDTYEGIGVPVPVEPAPGACAP